MGLAPATRDRVHAYWADRLGCDADALVEGATVVPARGGIARSVRVLVRPRATVLVAPPGLVDRLRGRVDRLEAVDAREPAALAGSLADALALDAEPAFGPQFVGYADASTLAPRDAEGIRPLDAGDRPALARLRAACPDAEWYDRVGGFAVDAHDAVLGRFVGDELVAVAAYGVDDGVAGIGVLTHPARRQEGHGAATVAALAGRALDDGLVPEYRAHEDWTASVELARSVGFGRYGTYLGLVPTGNVP